MRWLLACIALPALFLSELTSAGTAFPPCCWNTTSSTWMNATGDCICLGDNLLHAGSIDDGQPRHFHWALSAGNSGLINLDDTKRFLHVKMEPCAGQARLLVNTIVAPTWPTNQSAQFRSDNTMEANEITMYIDSSQYFISVLPDTQRLNFTIQAVTFYGHVPNPGGNGSIAAWTPVPTGILLEGDPMDMKVKFTTSPDADLEYQVYYRPRTPLSTLPCGKSSPDFMCNMRTFCGAVAIGLPVLPIWTPYPKGLEVSIVVPRLTRGESHVFQVVARNQTDDLAWVAYTPTEGIPTFTRQTTAQAPVIILIIFSLAGAAVIVLIVGVVLLKKLMKRQYQRVNRVDEDDAWPRNDFEKGAGKKKGKARKHVVPKTGEAAGMGVQVEAGAGEDGAPPMDGDPEDGKPSTADPARPSSASSVTTVEPITGGMDKGREAGGQ